jgi:alkylation response protein AidB-like acyl-CoA dehydrogenase
MIHPMGVKMVGPVLMAFGTPEQKAKYLPDIRASRTWWAQGFSEPGSGSDLASLRSTAVLEPDGRHFVVNGHKVWTSYAQWCSMMFALVRTDPNAAKPQEGISFLLIDMQSPGITIRPINTIGGEHEVNQVFFDDVRVPIADRVGDEGQGWAMGKYLLEFERGGSIASARMRLALQKVERVLAEVRGASPLDARTEGRDHRAGDRHRRHGDDRAAGDECTASGAEPGRDLLIAQAAQ